MIFILWATIRPEMFLTNYKRWMENAKNPDKITTLVAVNTIEDQDIILKNYSDLNVTVVGETIGITTPIYALSKDLKASDEDITIVVCDDVACIPNWDEFLFNQFSSCSGGLFINDGIQSIAKFGHWAITMPVMDVKTLKKMNGIIFHPAYKHYYSDNELYYNLVDLGLLVDIRDNGIIFQHEHFYLGKRDRDEHDVSVVTNCSEIDRITFDKRMKLPVEERIKYE